MKNLFILFDQLIDPLSIPENTDILPITSNAMELSERHGLIFKKLEDFYTTDEHDIHLNILEGELISVLKKLDDMYGDSIHCPRPYSGNMFWFLHRLSDLMYITKVSEKINNEFETIYYLQENDGYDISVPPVSIKNLNLPMYGANPKRILSLIINNNPKAKVLNIEEIGEGKNIDPGFRIRIKAFTLKVFFVGTKKIIRLIQNAKKTLVKKKGAMFVIQGGYEVEAVRPYLSDFNYLFPQKNIVDNWVNAINHNEDDKENERYLIINEFIKKHFSLYKQNVLDFFNSYHKEIVENISRLGEQVKLEFEKHKPAGLLYSIGSETVLEDIFAHYANKLSVPIFYFKHTGSDSIFRKYDPFLDYNERNQLIKKTLFVQSKKEMEMIKDLKNTLIKPLGGIEFYNTFHTKTKRNKKILYCRGVPAHFTYKASHYVITDYQRYNLLNCIINISEKSHLDLYVKLNPIDKNESFEQFNKQIQINKIKHTKLIYDIRIESILPNYGLIILDIISSRVLSFALLLNVPIILYLPNENQINMETMDDLNSRVYIAKSISDLEKLLIQFKQNGLDSRWSEKIVDKYIFPTNNHHPGINTANEIRYQVENLVA